MSPNRATGALLLALLVLPLWTAGAEGTPQPGHLTGTVKNALNAPLAEVTITVRGPASQVARTDVDGRFDVPGLPEGTYELVATLSGFAPARRTVRLTPGKSTIVSLTLTVAAQEQTVVTAAKTGERDVQTTPMAVSVLKGADLQQAESHNVADIAGDAPTVTFSQNSDFAQLTIRGIGSNVVFAGTDPSSAVYVDGVYLSRPVTVLGDFLDLERVEVLRGPQGTLYGRNAVGGAINLVTKPPTNTLDASARFVAGNLGTFRTEARLSGPIVRDRIMGSAAILRGVRDGFVRDLDHPDHSLGGEDVTAVRSKLHVVFNARSNLLVAGDMTHQDPIPLTYAKVLAVKPGFQVDNPADLHEVRASTLAEGRILQYGGTARFTATLPASTTLTSTTAFRKLEYDVMNDADITELNLTAVHLHEDQHQWSEEVTISQQRPRLSWIAGLFLFNEVDRQPTLITLIEPRRLNLLNPEVEAGNQAVFGQATIDLTSRVSVTAGLRYSREHKTIDNAGQLSTIDLPVTLVPGSAYAYTDAIAHTAWTPKFGLEFRARENAFVYVSATRGFKSGGFNFTSPEAGRGYAPEWAWSYEGGTEDDRRRRSRADQCRRLSHRLLRFASANGHSAGRDRHFECRRGNDPRRRARGLDSSHRGSARRRTSGVAGSNLRSVHRRRGRRYHRRCCRQSAHQRTGIVGTSLAPVERQPRSSRAGFTQGDIQVAEHCLLHALQRPHPAASPFGLLDGSAEFGPKRRHWSVTIWGRNLTNSDYITGSFSSPIPAIGGRPGLPRQAGVELTLRP